MPQGYYTIEQWKPGKVGWTEIATLPFGLTLTAAEEYLENLGKPGFFRIVQMQRVIWAEAKSGKLHLRKSHAGSPANLESQRKMFHDNGGRFPAEAIREARRRQKSDRSR